MYGNPKKHGLSGIFNKGAVELAMKNMDAELTRIIDEHAEVNDPVVSWESRVLESWGQKIPYEFPIFASQTATTQIEPQIDYIIEPGEEIPSEVNVIDTATQVAQENNLTPDEADDLIDRAVQIYKETESGVVDAVEKAIEQTFPSVDVSPTTVKYGLYVLAGLALYMFIKRR